MPTKNYILEVEGLADQTQFDLAKNALFKEILIFDLSLSSNKKRLTVRIKENTLKKVLSILEKIGHSARQIRPGPCGVEGLFS